ncbi:MAG: DUF4293 domain-containing protein [Bacteroidota bacterium]
MIQRIQSLFFLLAALCILALLFVPFWKYDASGSTQFLQALSVDNIGESATPGAISFSENPLHMGFFGLSIVIPLLLLVVIFLFNNRPRQISLGFVALMLSLILILVMVFFSRQGPYGGFTPSEGTVQLGLAFPMVAVVLIWLGIKRVQADEALVKSVDRIR